MISPTESRSYLSLAWDIENFLMLQTLGHKCSDLVSRIFSWGLSGEIKLRDLEVLSVIPESLCVYRDKECTSGEQHLASTPGPRIRKTLCSSRSPFHAQTLVSKHKGLSP